MSSPADAGDPLAVAPLTGVLVGYGRVSTRDQNLARQETGLKAAGCAKCFFDKASGKNTGRPGPPVLPATGRAPVAAALGRLRRSTPCPPGLGLTRQCAHICQGGTTGLASDVTPTIEKAAMVGRPPKKLDGP